MEFLCRAISHAFSLLAACSADLPGRDEYDFPAMATEASEGANIVGLHQELLRLSLEPLFPFKGKKELLHYLRREFFGTPPFHMCI
jgi:hypothetical protein